MAAFEQRYGARCLKCGATERLHWDHVVPLSRGGRHCVSNLQRLCKPCNEAKHTKVADYRSVEQLALTFEVLRENVDAVLQRLTAAA